MRPSAPSSQRTARHATSRSRAPDSKTRSSSSPATVTRNPRRHRDEDDRLPALRAPAAAAQPALLRLRAGPPDCALFPDRRAEPPRHRSRRFGNLRPAVLHGQPRGVRDDERHARVRRAHRERAGFRMDPPAADQSALAVGPVIGGGRALLAFVGGTWFPISEHGFLHSLAQAMPSYWLVQASKVAVEGGAWGATGWLVVAAWSLALGALALQVYRRDSGRRCEPFRLPP